MRTWFLQVAGDERRRAGHARVRITCHLDDDGTRRQRATASNPAVRRMGFVEWSGCVMQSTSYCLYGAGLSMQLHLGTVSSQEQNDSCLAASEAERGRDAVTRAIVLET
jgi:hypothetical protein